MPPPPQSILQRPHPPSYDQATNRLKELRELVGQYSPTAFCEEESKATIIDPLRGAAHDDDLISARNIALIEAWKAIRAISGQTIRESEAR